MAHRSVVWDHFRRISREQAECTLCLRVLKCNSSTSSLMKHFISFHSGNKEDPEYTPKVKKAKTNVNIINIKKEILEIDNPETLNLEDIVQNDSKNVSLSVVKRQKKYNPRSIKKSIVWNYFTRLSRDVAQCNICSLVLKCCDGSTSGLMRHVKSHDNIQLNGDFKKKKDNKESQEYADTSSIIYNCQKSLSESIFNKTDNTNTFDTETIVEREFRNDSQTIDEGELTLSMSKMSSEVWKYFSRVSAQLAQCNTCGLDFLYSDDSTEELMEHSKSHDNIAENKSLEEQEDAEEVKDGDENHSCSQLFQSLDKSSSNISSLEIENKDTFKTKDIVENDISDSNIKDCETNIPFYIPKSKYRSIVWKYFTRTSKVSAKCNVCGVVLRFTDGTTSSLLNHCKIHKSFEENLDIDETEVIRELNFRGYVDNGFSTPEVKDGDSCSEQFQHFDQSSSNKTSPKINNTDISKTKDIVENDFTNTNIKDSETNIPKSKYRSIAWKYFTRTSKVSAKCNVCGVVLRFTDGTTSSLLKHCKIHKSFEENLDIDETEVIRELNFRGYVDNGFSTQNIPNCDSTLSNTNSTEVNNTYSFNIEDIVERDFANECLNSVKISKTGHNRQSKSRSEVWKYFTRLSRDSAQCNICSVVLKCCSGSTSGLKKHLKIHEIFEENLDIEKIIKIEDKETSNKGVAENNSFIPPLKSINSSLPKPCNIWKYFRRVGLKRAECNRCKEIVDFSDDFVSSLKYHYKINHGFFPGGYKKKRSISIEAEVAKLVCKDGLSFKVIVESTFIQKSLQLCVYNNPAPTSKDEVLTYILYFSKLKRLQLTDFFRSELEKGHRFSLTLNEFTTKQKRRYFEINVHSEKNHRSLGLVRASRDNAATVDKVTKRLKDFSLDIKQNIVACTSAIFNSCKLINPIYQNCIAYGLNKCICDVLYNDLPSYLSCSTDNKCVEDIQSIDEEEEEEDGVRIEKMTLKPELQKEYDGLIKKVRRICTKFKKPLLENGEIQGILKDMNSGQECSLIVDVKTKWNSIMHMLERFLLLKECIPEAFCDEDIVFAEEWIEIKNMVDVLKMLEISMKELSSVESSLLKAESSFVFIMNKLKDRNDSLSIALLKSLNFRFSYLRQKDVIGLMQYLYNPNYEPTGLEEATREEIKTLAESVYNRLYPEITEGEVLKSETVNTQNLNIQDPLVFNLFDQLKALSESKKDSKSFEMEMKVYEFTRTRTEKLDRLFAALLTIKPVSIDREKLFSTSCFYPSLIRTSLSDEALDAHVFLNSYFRNTDEL